MWYNQPTSTTSPGSAVNAPGMRHSGVSTMSASDNTACLPLKQCTRCNELFPATPLYFSRKRGTRDGLVCLCKNCRSLSRGNKGLRRWPPIDVPNGYRDCIECREIYPATEEYFYTNPNTRSKLSSRCKRCDSNYHKQYTLEHLEENRNRSRKWKKDNADRINAYQRQRYHDNLTKSREYNRQKQARRRSATRLRPRRTRFITSDGTLRCSQCHKLKPATVEYFSPRRNDCVGFSIYCRKCSNLNDRKRRERIGRAKLNERARRLYNPTKGEIKNQKRRARELSLPNAFSPSDWNHALVYFNGVCAVCGRPPGLWHTLSVDHWIPLSDVEHCLGTVPANIVPLCHGIDGCNNSKGDSNPIEWLNRRFGPRKAKRILKRIQAYFDSLKDTS